MKGQQGGVQAQPFNSFIFGRETCMKQIFVLNASSPEERQNLERSIENPLSPEELLKFFPENERDEVKTIAEQQRGFYAWGAIPEPKNNGRWKRMNPGDWVLVAVNNQYRYICQMLKKCDNKDFAAAVWGSDPKGGARRLIFFLTRPIAIHVAVDDLKDYLQDRYGGFTRLADHHLCNIEHDFGTVDAFIQRKLIGTESAPAPG